jgi:predicted Zn-dependent protease
VGLAACGPADTVYRPAQPAPVPLPAPAPVADWPADPQARAEAAVARFRLVRDRIEPAAEALCRRQPVPMDCDFQILVDTRPGPINALQTRDDAGRPVLVLTGALLLDARSDDELAFVMGHEAGHHIAGHLDRQRDSAVAGAVLAGALAALGGASSGAVRAAQDLGAAVGARTFSKDFELEADAIGTAITLDSGYDPVRGAGFFDRLPDPGNQFLGTHPPNAARIDTVRRTAARLRAGG